MGIQNGAAVVGNSTVVPQRAELPNGPTIPFLGMYPKD